jgi:hypothetical protein
MIGRSEWASWLLIIVIRYSLYGIELAALWFLAAASWPGRGVFARVGRAFGWLARRRRLAVVATGLAVLAGRAALMPLLPIRAPLITDEFSYLLSGDTFSRGRLTNPTHPLWQQFETIHVIHRPTYASMYPVAQGLILAAGEKIAGHPWVGVYVSTAVMCALVCWMLAGWLPLRWALLGGLLAVLRLGLFGYWMNSYWGGAAAACGGLLVLGAAPRIQRRRRVRDALLLACGVAILANSRPYEGLVLSLAVAGWMGWWLVRQPERRRLAAKLLVPVALVLGVTGLAMGYYCWRVTGSPLHLPQQLDRDQYATAGYFVWESPKPVPEYRHSSIREFYVTWELTRFLETKTAGGLAKNLAGNLGAFWLFFLGPALTVPLIFGWRLFRDRRLRPLVVIGAVCMAGLLLNTWSYPHYAAPMVGVIYVLVVQGIRHLHASGGRSAVLGRAVIVVCLGMTAVRIAVQPFALYMPTDWPMTWYYTRPGNVARAQIDARLRALPGSHLVLVRYGAHHNGLEQWVYNEASIDTAKVVWAHEMDEAHNRALVDYFKDRRVWLLEPDAAPPVLTAIAK